MGKNEEFVFAPEPNMSLERVKTIEPTVHQLDLPSSSELSVCSSYEEYVQTILNGRSVLLSLKS